MILHRGSRKARRRARSVAKAVIEHLENRQLLTAMHGGDILEFIDSRGQTIRVKADGPSSAQYDLIGSTFVPGQGYVLNQIPANIQRPDGTVVQPLGGFGGADGVEPIGVITGAPESETDIVNPNIGNPASPAFGLPQAVAPSAGANIAQLSSNSKGNTWGFNEIQQNVGGAQVRRVELMSINYRNASDPARGITPADAIPMADLAPQIVNVTGGLTTAAINGVIACDFLPSNDNLLYFVVSVNVIRPRAVGGGMPAAAPIPFLLTVDFSQPVGSSVSLVGEFISDQGNAGSSDVAPTVFGMTFTSNDRLVAFVTGRAVGGRGDTTGIGAVTGLIETAANNPTFDLFQITPVTLNGVALTTLRSLEVVPGDDGFTYAINGTAATTTLLHIDRGNGNAVNFGLLPDPDDGRVIPRGFNLGDLAWNPALSNNFLLADDDPSNDTKKGALIAEDTVTDELVTIDARNRFPNTDLYSVFATNTTSESSLSIAQVDETDPTRPMIPYVAALDTFGVVNAQNGTIVNIAAPAGTGRALVGARIPSTTPPTISLAPRRLRKTPSAVFGNFPKSSKYVYAGITINGDINNVLVGGTIMGNVRVFGSANILYAGLWLTGDGQGRLESDVAADLEGNVYVGADARNILAGSLFGTSAYGGGDAPTYVTGFNIAVGGKLGQLQALDSYVGTGTYVSNTVVGNGNRIQEIEDKRGSEGNGPNTYFQGFAGGPPSLGGTAGFFNDAFETPQYVGTALNRGIGTDQVAIIDGTLGQPDFTGVGDNIDYYALALLGGQSVTVQLSTVGNGNITVFDPDGRLIDSDLMVARTPQVLRGKPFRFTADRPGTYRFAASGSGNYTLRITGVADVALGGAVAAGSIFSYDTGITPFRVHRGDAGAFFGGVELIDNSLLPYTVDRGNLRTLESASIGTLTATTLTLNGVDLAVPRGSVGLMRTTGAVMEVNNRLTPLGANGLPDSSIAIGGDYQLVDCAGEFASFLIADRAIGTLRCQQMTTLTPFLIANADRRGSDGIIDLIDVAGDMVPTGGGAHIFTGPGGNVRYMRVAGTSAKSSKFGSSVNSPITLDPGATIRLTDDSGTSFKLTPTPLVPNTNIFLPTDPRFLNPGQLQYLTYGVDDAQGAGVILMNVTVISPDAFSRGLLVEAGAQGTNGSVEIATINVATPGAGRAFVLTPDPVDANNPPTISTAPRSNLVQLTAPDTNTPLDIVFKGGSTVDVFSITGAGTIDMINNDTPDGEVVNVLSQGIGDIAADWIGIAKSHTGEDKSHSANAVNQFAIQDDGGTAGGATSPFVQQRNLIRIAGGGTPYLVTARARRGIGNISVDGIIGNIVADSNHKQGKGRLDGIDGPIVANAIALPFTGRIQSVDIGQGINFGGRGEVPFSGIFASDVIQLVFGEGEGKDIRGPILVNGGGALHFGNDALSIGRIDLEGGSIVSSPIVISSSYNDWRNTIAGLLIPQDIDDPNNPRFDLGPITIKGGGGIIGSFIIGPDIDTISIDGFGFLNSRIKSLADNTIAGVDTTGYGIRGSFITDADQIGDITARGTGALLDVNTFDSSVRIAAKKKVDPFFGIAPNENTDLYRFFGLTEKTFKKKSISASGVIENTSITGTGNLNKISSYQIRSRNDGTTVIDISNKINKINVLDGTDIVELSAGALSQFTTGSDVYNTSINVSGPITRINVGGTLRGSSTVIAKGPEGSISTITTKRGMFATVNSTLSIGSLIVGSDLGSTNISAINKIDLISVGGSILKGTNIAFVRENGGILPFKQLSELVIAGDLEAGATIRVKKLLKQKIGGSVDGNIIVG